MSKQYVPGPSAIFAGVGVSGAWEHLGFTEQTVRINTAVKHQGVSADFGAEMDVDQQFKGEEIYISFRLSRFNESVLTLCRQRLASPLSTAPGMGAAGALGALMVLEGNTYPLAVVCQYGSAGLNKTVFSDMLPGIVIPKAYMADSTDVEFGTGYKVPSVVFRGQATFGLDGSYSLFTSVLSGYTFPSVA